MKRVRSFLDFDRTLLNAVQHQGRTRGLTPIMIMFTRAGTKGALWLLFVLPLLVVDGQYGREAAAITVAALLLAEGSINLVLKPLIGRERPFARHVEAVLLVPPPGPNSWPSAHAGSSAAAATVLSVLYPVLSPIFVGAAVLVSYSRVYVGVHYPFDVLAGIVIGMLAAGATLGVSDLVLHWT